jgi:hypothetical protein
MHIFTSAIHYWAKEIVNQCYMYICALFQLLHNSVKNEMFPYLQCSFWRRLTVCTLLRVFCMDYVRWDGLMLLGSPFCLGLAMYSYSMKDGGGGGGRGRGRGLNPLQHLITPFRRPPPIEDWLKGRALDREKWGGEGEKHGERNYV